METIFEPMLYVQHNSMPHSSDSELVSLSMSVFCPNCGEERRHREYVSKAIAQGIGIRIAESSLQASLTYDQLAEVNKKAGQLFANPPVHRISDCFNNLRNEIDDLRSQVRSLEDDGLC